MSPPSEVYELNSSSSSSAGSHLHHRTHSHGYDSLTPENGSSLNVTSNNLGGGKAKIKAKAEKQDEGDNDNDDDGDADKNEWGGYHSSENEDEQLLLEARDRSNRLDIGKDSDIDFLARGRDYAQDDKDTIPLPLLSGQEHERDGSNSLQMQEPGTRGKASKPKKSKWREREKQRSRQFAKEMVFVVSFMSYTFESFIQLI